MGKFDLSRIVGVADVSDSDTELREILLDKIRENPENFYPPLPEDEAEALRESIQANGLLEPLLVVPDGATYRLVSGHNRLRALRDLRANAFGMDYKTALCRVLPAMDADHEITAIIEANRQRKKTPAVLQQEAEALTEVYVRRKQAGEELPGRIRDRVAEAMQVSATKLANLNAIKNGLKDTQLIVWWQTGTMPDGTNYLVLDGWAGTGGNALASSMITYDAQAGFLQVYNPPQVTGFYRATLRYDVNLLSTDVNGDGTVDIPTEITDGGELSASLENRLRYLLWRDFATQEGGNNIFGVYDSEYRFFLELPESMHGNVMLRGNLGGDGWAVCNLSGTVTYCELRVVDLNEESAELSTEEGGASFSRVANLGGKQLQARMVTEYYGLELDDIIDGVTVLE